MSARPAAVILAGGQGSRLGGVRKPDLRLGGIRLIDRVASRLSPPCTPILVATGPAAGGAPLLPAGTIGVPDLPIALGGPLAGLLAAALHPAIDQATHLVSIAVDTPCFPDDMVDRLLAALGHAPAAACSWRGISYPTNAIWPLDVLRATATAWSSGTGPHSPRALLASIGATEVDFSALAEDPFANINTLADLLALARRLPSVTGFTHSPD
jgi:molybdopterin-guanine dinucleotide biosynthesis protein A